MKEWYQDDNKEVSIRLEKADGSSWWDSVIKGAPKIDTTKITPENSKLSDLDGETRAMVEKMMYDNAQKVMNSNWPFYRNLVLNDMYSKWVNPHRMSNARWRSVCSYQKESLALKMRKQMLEKFKAAHPEMDFSQAKIG